MFSLIDHFSVSSSVDSTLAVRMKKENVFVTYFLLWNLEFGGEKKHTIILNLTAKNDNGVKFTDGLHPRSALWSL